MLTYFQGPKSLYEYGHSNTYIKNETDKHTSYFTPNKLDKYTELKLRLGHSSWQDVLADSCQIISMDNVSRRNIESLKEYQEVCILVIF